MKENTTEVKRYLRKVSKRLYINFIIKPGPFWCTLLVIYLALLAPYLIKYFFVGFWNPDFHLRASGFALQLLFVGVVANDLHKLRKIEELGLPSYRQLFKKWREDVANIFSTKTYPASYSAGTIRGAGSLSGIIESKRTGLELEKRVELLEKELQDYMKQTNEKIQKLKDDTKELEKDLKKEKRQREQDLKGVNEIIKKISVNGLKWEWAALFWLVVGLFFSIFPSELLSILNWL